MARILIVGCGYVGGALARRLLAAEHSVFGLRRDVSALPEGVEGIEADISRAGAIGVLPGGLDAVVFAVGAKRRDPEVYRSVYLDGLGQLLRALAEEGQRPGRVLFTSSTSVYGQSRGEWVDESSPTHPRDFAGELMLSAERLLFASPFASTSLRLGGLYGPGRERLLERIRAGRASEGPPRFTNRIHRDDAAGAIAHLILAPEAPEICLGVDADPADSHQVARWLAERLGMPSSIASGEAPAPPVGRRCSNARLRASGYRFLYPGFREGYGALIDASDAAASDA